MSLFDTAMATMELKPYWFEQETFHLWQSGTTPKQTVYLKCGGGYVNMMVKVGFHEIPHGFAVGVFDGVGLFEPFRMATEDAYNRWIEKTREHITRLKKLIAAQSEQARDALWVTKPNQPNERSVNQVDMYKTELFPYIEGGALIGKQATLTMTFVRTEELTSQGGQKETSYILHFKETEKGLILNKTNAKRIINLYGRETEEWRDKRITLYTEEVQAFGKKHNAIRVLDRIPPAANGHTISKPEPEPEEQSDNMPEGEQPERTSLLDEWEAEEAEKEAANGAYEN